VKKPLEGMPGRGQQRHENRDRCTRCSYDV
jgi:hypothetical protein